MENSKSVLPTSPPPLKEIASNFFQSISQWFRDLVDLKEGTDREGTIIAIKSSKRMRGANAWLLMASIMIASLGLDLDSPAVIIGAMLISPLMSPILGVGLGIAINDRKTLDIALNNFVIAILITLVTSTLYFTITPLGDLNESIDSRTKPTILDGLVAIFGGLAGIISTTRKDKTSAIPGVAIATALMPPLCVTGYGLAKLDWDIALNSFYLFFLNSFFITISSFLIIRLLNFPIYTPLNARDARRSRWLMSVVSIILVVPSGIILYNLWEDRQQVIHVEDYINDYFNRPDLSMYCIDYDFQKGDSTNLLVVQLVGTPIPEDSLPRYYDGLDQYQLHDTQLRIIQDPNLQMDEVRRLKGMLNNMSKVNQRLEDATNIQFQQADRIEKLEQEVDSLSMGTIQFPMVSREAKAVFPDLERLGYARLSQSNFQDSIQQFPVFLVSWPSNKRSSDRKRDEERLYNFLKVRTKLDTLRIINY